jgi:hypothetical protein
LVPSFREKYSSRENKHFKSLPVNLKNQNSKRVKGFDDGEVNNNRSSATIFMECVANTERQRLSGILQDMKFEVNKQSVTKIESLFLEIDVIAFKQFPLVGTSFKFYIW